MKTMTVRLPEALVTQIEAEAQRRCISKSDVIRQRLERAPHDKAGSHLDAIRHLIGSIDDLPPDLSSNVDHYVRKAVLARKGSR